MTVRFIRDVFVETYDPTIEGRKPIPLAEQISLHIFRGIPADNRCRWPTGFGEMVYSATRTRG
jgi:hypothetical protein